MFQEQKARQRCARNWEAHQQHRRHKQATHVSPQLMRHALSSRSLVHAWHQEQPSRLLHHPVQASPHYSTQVRLRHNPGKAAVATGDSRAASVP
ncbi:hypothetical protein BC831DRAFT_457086 [Entophlyctis helioformis]|nr:hypothetical protein BC831DRAFT_457086 [Entophlyctis helioformis]